MINFVVETEEVNYTIVVEVGSGGVGGSGEDQVARTAAATAQSTANSAVTSASAANTKATAAQGAADAAQGDADAAQAAADTAISNGAAADAKAADALAAAVLGPITLKYNTGTSSWPSRPSTPRTVFWLALDSEVADPSGAAAYDLVFKGQI